MKTISRILSLFFSKAAKIEECKKCKPVKWLKTDLPFKPYKKLFLGFSCSRGLYYTKCRKCGKFIFGKKKSDLIKSKDIDWNSKN